MVFIFSFCSIHTISVGIPILLFFILGDPYQRGFFCDDESLMHPFHESTIRNWMLYVIGLLLPLILVCSFFHMSSYARLHKMSAHKIQPTLILNKQIMSTEVVKSKVSQISSSSKVRLRVCSWDVPTWVTNTYKHVGFFAFGAVVSQLTTDIAKYSIGRLRPHFFDVSYFFILDIKCY